MLNVHNINHYQFVNFQTTFSYEFESLTPINIIYIDLFNERFQLKYRNMSYSYRAFIASCFVTLTP